MKSLETSPVAFSTNSGRQSSTQHVEPFWLWIWLLPDRFQPGREIQFRTYWVHQKGRSHRIREGNQKGQLGREGEHQRPAFSLNRGLQDKQHPGQIRKLFKENSNRSQTIYPRGSKLDKAIPKHGALLDRNRTRTETTGKGSLVVVLARAERCHALGVLVKIRTSPQESWGTWAQAVVIGGEDEGAGGQHRDEQGRCWEWEEVQRVIWVNSAGTRGDELLQVVETLTPNYRVSSWGRRIASILSACHRDKTERVDRRPEATERITPKQDSL